MISVVKGYTIRRSGKDKAREVVTEPVVASGWGQWAENRILEGCWAWTGLFPSLSSSGLPGVRWKLLGTFECYVTSHSES